MTLHPILAALRKHKAGVVLISLQIALTLAIVCNAIFIIQKRIDMVHRPTGLNEDSLFLVTQQWVGAPDGDDPAGLEKLDSMQQADLATLRNLPDVASVSPIRSLPLLRSGSVGGIGVKPLQQKSTVDANFFFGDEHMLSTLGLKLVAGRDFTAADVQHKGFRDESGPVLTIITKPIADKLFPHGDAVGKVIYFDSGSTPTTIVGIVARLQSPIDSGDSGLAWNSVMFPIRQDANFARYVLRAKPGRLVQAMNAVTPALYAANPMRVLDDRSVRSFTDIRARAYRADVGMAILMSVICLILLAVTAAGIVGLTSFWVGQRRRQIGVRRALGARKVDILHYFQLENLLIAGIGAVIGILLAVGLNLWLITRFEMERMPVIYVAIGVLAVLALGQAAVFVPARRASNVPPVVATHAA
jgi:putative ABC transport system permease protein